MESMFKQEMEPTYDHLHPIMNMGYGNTAKLDWINPEGSRSRNKLAFKLPPPALNRKIKEKDCSKAALSSSTVSSLPSSASNTNVVTLIKF